MKTFYLFLFIFIFFGESFKIVDLNISLFFLFLFLASNIIVILRIIFSKENIILNSYLSTILLYGILRGLFLGNKLSYILEDGLPFLVFFVTINYLLSLDFLELKKVIKIVILITTLLFFKVVIINYFPIIPVWGGNSFWQGSKSLVFGNFNRVILKGGEVFNLLVINLLLSFLIFNINLFKKNHLYILLLMNLVVIIYSLTRTSFIVTAVIVLISFVLKIKRSSLISKIKTSGLFLIFIVVSFFFLNSSIFKVRNEKDDGGSIATDWRQLESLFALEKASETNFLGNGFGASYVMPIASGNFKEDGQDLYVHNFYVWFLLKEGLIILLIGIYLVYRIFKNHKIKNDLLLTVKIVLFFFLILNETINNKFSGFSGAFVYSFLFATLIIMSKYDISTLRRNFEKQ